MRKKVTIYYNDTISSVSKLVGELLKKDPDFVELLVEDKGRIIIPFSKIVRIEERGEDKSENSTQ